MKKEKQELLWGKVNYVRADVSTLVLDDGEEAWVPFNEATSTEPSFILIINKEERLLEMISNVGPNGHSIILDFDFIHGLSSYVKEDADA